MNTLAAKNIIGVTTLTTASAISYDPSAILKIADQQHTLETLYDPFFGLSASDWLRLIAGLGVIVYIITGLVKGLKALIDLFR